MMDMKEIYFDNSATTKPDEAVVQEMLYMLTEAYANPSSLHRLGVQAEQKINDAREKVAKVLKVNPKEIIFTSGGTEANNIAILGAAKAYIRSGKHIITTRIEHPSVLNTFKALEKDGYQVTYLSVDQNGCINMDELLQELRSDTVLVSVMHVNNEVGAVHDIAAIGQAIKAKNPNTLFHVDAVQSFGKLVISPTKINVDLLSISSHKIHGPKGVGALYIRKGVKIIPIHYGGEHESGLRSGTENVPGIVGFGKAAQLAYTDLDANYQKVLEIKTALFNGLIQQFEDIQLIGPSIEEGLPYILNVAFGGIRAEVLLHALEDKEIYVSSGSACSSKKTKASHVLTAMGVGQKYLDCSIRFSFSRMNEIEQVEQCIDRMKPMIDMLKRFRRR